MSKLIESRQFNTYSRIHTHTHTLTQKYLALCVAVVVAACGTRFIVDKCAFIYRRHHSGSVAVHVCACKCECGLLSFVPSFIHFLFTEEHNKKARFKGKQRERLRVCECVDNTSKVKFKLNLTNKSQKLYARCCCTPYAALIAAGNSGGDALKN